MGGSIKDSSHPQTRFNWGGFYAGANIGFGQAKFNGMYDIEDYDPGDIFVNNGEGLFDIKPESVVGGIQIGYNWQRGSWVFGVEGDLSFANLAQGIKYGDDDDKLSAEISIFGSVRGRLGIAMDNVLLYGTAGVAWTNGKFTANDDFDDPEPGDFGSVKFNKIGFVYGGGIEYAINPRVSLKAEGLYYNFGDRVDTRNINDDGSEGDYTVFKDMFVGRVGLNIKLSQ